MCIDAVIFRMYQTFDRFSTRGLQNFIGLVGLILKLRDVEYAGPFCFEKIIEKKVRKIDIEIECFYIDFYIDFSNFFFQFFPNKMVLRILHLHALK